MSHELSVPSVLPAGSGLLWQFGEVSYANNQYNGDSSNAPVRVREQDGSICLVAAHAVNHYRDGRVKVADMYTGGLVRLLGAVAGVSTIINQTLSHELEPQTDVLTPSEAALRLMALRRPGMVVLDIHGARDNAVFDIALGTGPGPMTAGQERLCGLFAEVSQQYGLRCALNPEGYQATIAPALTNRARRLLGVENIVQVEVARSLREPSGDSATCLLGVMGEVIQRIRLS